MSIIGIDLGTTNSLVSVWENGKAVIIPNSLGENLTPSVVSIDENNNILVGKIAKERLITHPSLTVSNFKRFMGTKKEYILGDNKFLPEELSALVLKSLKADAEAYLGEEVTEAVISVPAYFNDSQRKATKRAGMLAGLKVERLISEPTAAALAYGLHTEEEETQFLVFDLGGGTFDVSILDFFDGVMEVKSIAGDNYLGGEDFNNVIATYFLKCHDIAIQGLKKEELASLYKQAELCKRQLSEGEVGKMKVVINLEELILEIDRQTFEKITEELIFKLKKPINRALKDSNTTADELDSIILIGGSTKMPLVKSVVSKMFGKLPYTSINPDEAVALGASVQAALKTRNKDLKEMILTDVCPYTLGTEIANVSDNGQLVGGYFLPIIERNSSIPTSKVKPLVPLYDKQTELQINIYQGESLMVEDNIKLGEIQIFLPKGKINDKQIELRYTYDINGLLEVECKILKTNEIKTLIIENSPGTMSKEEINRRIKELQKYKIHPREKDENRLVIARGEALYQEALGDVRQYIGELIVYFKTILESQEQKKIEEAAKEVNKKFDEIERIYL